MSDTGVYSQHTFHIPVMGTGFTIDTPLKVARYGISSVISLVDDVLIEQMRQYHSEHEGEPYEEITNSDPDARAHRITAYLDLLGRLVQKQMDALRAAPFEPGSEITTYYELLPECPLKDEYRALLASPGNMVLEQHLREQVVPGSIDVNIMTKLDCDAYWKGEKLPPEYSDAKSALRGFALSKYASSIVCSAGLNREMYQYFTAFDDFFPAADGTLRKKIVMKVSDFRSAEVQGKYLAKRGIWISEYRIESGLNCGGHAFATKGTLLGPILAEFRDRRADLAASLYEIFREALASQGKTVTGQIPSVRVTAQGGIGTADEHSMLLRYYEVDSVGWGTPFLLVPDVVNVDDEHLVKLAAAGSDDVYLSDSSPLGVPFWNLRNSASEEARRARIAAGTPGSPCRKGYIKFSTDRNGQPVCRASRAYQAEMLAACDGKDVLPAGDSASREAILVKSCICHDLAGGATLRHGIDPDAKTAICPGPNIAYFSRVASFREMVDHIYGRMSLMTNPLRSHMFVNELKIYIDYYRNEAEQNAACLSGRTQKYLEEFKQNLSESIEFYLQNTEQFLEEQREMIIREFTSLKASLDMIPIAVPAT